MNTNRLLNQWWNLLKSNQHACTESRDCKVLVTDRTCSISCKKLAPEKSCCKSLWQTYKLTCTSFLHVCHRHKICPATNLISPAELITVASAICLSQHRWDVNECKGRWVMVVQECMADCDVVSCNLPAKQGCWDVQLSRFSTYLFEMQMWWKHRWKWND